MKYFYNPPLPVKLLFRDSIWNSVKDKVLLTFDDGPVPGNTEKLLAKLEIFKIKAVFFCVGNNVRKYPELISNILSGGHLIGNHTMNHKIIHRADIKTIEEEIMPFNRIMEDKFDYSVKYFRPPHGRYSFQIRKFLRNNEMKNVMWSLLTYDYKNNLDELEKSLNYIKKNSIVVLHDSIKSTSIISDALDIFADVITKKGYTAGTPGECLK